jgi:anti-sigma-K factor RskA
LNIQEYIASGILESYVLGVTSEQENAEVQRLAEQHPQIKAEIEAVRASLEAYIMQYEQIPPVALKKKIWHKLEQLEEEENSLPVNDQSSRPLVASPRQETASWKKYLMAASLSGLIISLGANIALYNQLQHTQQQLAEANTSNLRMAEDLQINKANYDKATQELAVLSNPDNKSIYLKGQEPAPDAAVMVYWNSKEQDVHVAVHNLPAPGDGKQYQLWAIVDGKPVDAGMLELEDARGGLQKMKNIEKAQAFAISLEKKGGNPAPEGKIYVLGNV